ncbi:MAG: recombination mediator RecR [bacterium]|nr:recombination mediator RecR [bacterium]
MNVLPKALSRLIESFSKLPGIGPKTAQRLAFYLLHVPQEELEEFAGRLSGLRAHTVLCSICKNVAERDPCDICESTSRNKALLCVVEQPTDLLSIERTGTFHGVYHVLHGSIDPLNTLGPDEMYIADRLRRVGNGSGISEVILATNPNMEGEATAMYIQKELATRNSQPTPFAVTRLAHGLPVGADIEYADEVTLARALEGRRGY